MLKGSENWCQSGPLVRSLPILCWQGHSYSSMSSLPTFIMGFYLFLTAITPDLMPSYGIPWITKRNTWWLNGRLCAARKVLGDLELLTLLSWTNVWLWSGAGVFTMTPFECVANNSLEQMFPWLCPFHVHRSWGLLVLESSYQDSRRIHGQLKFSVN